MLSDHTNLLYNNHDGIFNNDMDLEMHNMLDTLDATLVSIQNNLQSQSSVPNDSLDPLVTLSSPAMLNFIDHISTINVHSAAPHISVDALRPLLKSTDAVDPDPAKTTWASRNPQLPSLPI